MKKLNKQDSLILIAVIMAGYGTYYKFFCCDLTDKGHDRNVLTGIIIVGLILSIIYTMIHTDWKSKNPK